jgi:hypothetical protein
MTLDTMSGLFVMVPDLPKAVTPPPAADRLITALKKAGFTTYGVWGRKTPPDEVELLVGFKPDAAP